MITKEELSEWTTICADLLADIHQAAQKCLRWPPLTAESATCLNMVNGAAGELANFFTDCDKLIKRRYKEAKEHGDTSPPDARDAVEHMRELKQLALPFAKVVKAQCRHWNAGTWGQPPTSDVDHNWPNADY